MNEEKETTGIGTPFDDVFRTLLEKCRKLIIPVINEVFRTEYSVKEKVELLSNEHFFVDEEGKLGKRITDSCIRIRNRLYHIECESSKSINSSYIAVRMIEYDFHISLSNSEDDGTEQVLRFPHSAVLMLRSTDTTPDTLKIRLVMPDGTEALYAVPSVKVKKYTKEEIFEKNLLFFIPYYILSFEKDIKRIENNEKALKELLDDYRDIYDRLHGLADREVIDERYLSDLISLTVRLVEVVTRNSQKVSKEMVTMGGEVLELESDRMLAKGISQGKAMAIVELLEECGAVPEELKQKIFSQNDESILRKWNRLSATVSSVEEFIAGM